MSNIDQAPGAEGTATPLTSTRRRRGFAAMNPAKQREIASIGGKAAHASGHAHEFTPQEAREAGRKRHERARSAKPQ